jgi:hypothetical protein
MSLKGLGDKLVGCRIYRDTLIHCRMAWIVLSTSKSGSAAMPSGWCPMSGPTRGNRRSSTRAGFRKQDL